MIAYIVASVALALAVVALYLAVAACVYVGEPHDHEAGGLWTSVHWPRRPNWYTSRRRKR